MIRIRLRSFVSPASLALLAAVVTVSTASAQSSIGMQGFGYPVGGGSVRTNGTGGAFAEFDALTPTNPAALGGLTRTVITAQAEPELRKLTGNGVSEKSTLQRIPLIMLIFPARRGVAVGLSATTFLDRTFSTATTGSARIDGISIPTSDRTDVRGAINDLRAGAGWQISPRFRVGVAGHLYTGENRATRERAFADTLKLGSVIDSSRVTYFGTALSVGGEATLGKGFTALASYRRGNEINARIRDTIVSKASAPTRTGAALRYDGIVGSVFAVGIEQISWSRMASLGSATIAPTDAMNWHAGAEVAGPKFRGLPVLVRAGYARNELPFGTPGQTARENRLSAGLGLPVAGEDATLDLSVQRASRTMSGSGFKDSAWLLGIGIQIRPRN
ncbi:hypothetical protein [Gemmatimonas sp.]|uniref:hypothetical protein n=1 Tax=Gemmatimonas sp. TaxID=1962908 RepID=UPI00356A6FC9